MNCSSSVKFRARIVMRPSIWIFERVGIEPNSSGEKPCFAGSLEILTSRRIL